jgi:diaminopimelate decarboxylase
MLIPGEIYYRHGTLHCEDVPLTQLAGRFGTPAYVYSKNAITTRFAAYKEALEGLPHLVCYAVKANSNLTLLSMLAAQGAGFDIVSGGELYRVLAAGANPARVVFSGVGKTADEIEFALSRGIHSFNCESEAELYLISRVAVRLGCTAKVAMRVNPDVNAATHPYISTGLREHKFGVPIEQAHSIYARGTRLPELRMEGVSCHIGSQLLDTGPLLEAAAKVMVLLERLRASGIPIQFVDLGGGIGVPYRSGESAVPLSAFLAQLRTLVEGRDLTLLLEPGRSVVAEAGLLLTRVVLTKNNGRRTFVIVDAGMNDLLRPSLYQAHHEIIPVVESHSSPVACDIVGPVCETGDFFARSRELPPVQTGDLLAIRTTGAYGFVLSSNYNSRPRACELFVHGADICLARKRESYEDLIRLEQNCHLT